MITEHPEKGFQREGRIWLANRNPETGLAPPCGMEDGEDRQVACYGKPPEVDGKAFEGDVDAGGIVDFLGGEVELAELLHRVGEGGFVGTVADHDFPPALVHVEVDPEVDDPRAVLDSEAGPAAAELEPFGGETGFDFAKDSATEFLQ